MRIEDVGDERLLMAVHEVEMRGARRAVNEGRHANDWALAADDWELVAALAIREEINRRARIKDILDESIDRVLTGGQ